jgi:hypothetical protein
MPRCKTTCDSRAVLIARRAVDRFRIRRHVSLMIWSIHNRLGSEGMGAFGLAVALSVDSPAAATNMIVGSETIY